MTVRVIHGDMLAELPKLAADGAMFDACVTDPPYHLTSQVATVRSAFPGRYAGTTGAAALRLGFEAVLIEREAEYVADIRARLAHVSGDDAPLFAKAT